MNGSGDPHWVRRFEVIGYVLYTILFGFFGLSLMYTDFGPGERESLRVGQIVAFYFLFGMPIGYFFPRRWWLGAGLSWASAVLGLIAFFGSFGRSGGQLLMALVVFSFPLLLAAAGGWAGAYMFERRHPRAHPDDPNLEQE